MRKFKFFVGIDKNVFVMDQRPMRVVWEPDMAEDLNYHHGINAEAELTNLLSSEIARTIDENIINDIYRKIVKEGYYRKP